jgi:hypothetical protein
MTTAEVRNDIPQDVLTITQLAELHLAKAVPQLLELDTNIIYQIRLQTIDLVVKAINESPFEERTGLHQEDSDLNGFGTKSPRTQEKSKSSRSLNRMRRNVPSASKPRMVLRDDPKSAGRAFLLGLYQEARATGASELRHADCGPQPASLPRSRAK